MKRMLIPTVVALLVGSLTAQAALHDRGNGMIYDDYLDITWLQNANQGAGSIYDDGVDPSDGLMTWANAKAWAEHLVHGGYDDWRLPTAFNIDGTGPCEGGYCYYSELGFMYYGNMDTEYLKPITSGNNKANLALFTNLYGYAHWSEERECPEHAWMFFTDRGTQGPANIYYEYFAWAVRDGDVASGLKNVTLKSSVVAGCKSVTGTVTLAGPAPAEGVVVTLSDSLVSASTSATLKILAGATSKTFTVKTQPVDTEETGTVSATLGSQTLSQPLTVRPMGLTSITPTPTTVVGSNEVTGKATLECKAGPGPIMVDLASSKPEVAYPVAANMSIPVGIQSQTFDVMTNPVLVKTSATISGTANGITKSKALTVNVAATVSPASLKFGNVPINTSKVLSTTLSNKGAVSCVIDGIALTGTNAKYYAQTSDCGATLEAGASCTIGVTFTPTVIGSKSAKLSIATSATATPLSVSLSGTGILAP